MNVGPLGAKPVNLSTGASLTPEEELTRALRDYLYEMHSYGPRKGSHWVMSLEWLKEVHKLDDRRPWDFPLPGAPETILGIPIEVREDGGPPHLELLPLKPP